MVVERRSWRDPRRHGAALRFAAVADLLATAEPALLAHSTLLGARRGQIRSINPLKRLNEEIKRQTAIAATFPNLAGLIRQVRMILAEQDNEWQDGLRYFRPETMVAIDAVLEHKE